jgi:hypothetical protein
MATVVSNGNITIQRYNNMHAIDISILDKDGYPYKEILVDKDVRFLSKTLKEWIDEMDESIANPPEELG